MNDEEPTRNFSQRWNDLVPFDEKKLDEPGEIYAAAQRGDFDQWFADGFAFTRATGAEADFIIRGGEPGISILCEPSVNDAAISRRLQGALRSKTFQIQQRFVHVLVGGRASRAKVCIDNFTMIRDPIYGGLKKQLNWDEFRWVTFDLEMWQGHRAYLEFCDQSVPDPSEDGKLDPEGYLVLSQIVFSDKPAPPVRATTSRWLSFLGSEAPDSLDALARRYQEALSLALSDWELKRSWSSQAGRERLAFLDWLVQKDLLVVESNSEPLKALITQYRALEAQFRSRLPFPAWPMAMASMSAYLFGETTKHRESLPRGIF